MGEVASRGTSSPFTVDRGIREQVAPESRPRENRLVASAERTGDGPSRFPLFDDPAAFFDETDGWDDAPVSQPAPAGKLVPFFERPGSDASWTGPFRKLS
jgi:hypothetical protein